MFEVVVGILSGLASAVVVAGFFWSIFADLKRSVKKLETERIVKLENRLDKHIEDDCSQRILAKIETILDEQNKMDAKLDRIGEDTAKQAAQIAANASYIANLDSSFQQHKITGGHYHGNN